MKLKELLESLYPAELPSRFAELDVVEVSCDSRNVRPQGLFVALEGTRQNGADFIPEAIRRGATVIVKNHDTSKPGPYDDVCLLTVPDTKKFLAAVSQKFFDYPALAVKTIGITGTNGKTTTSYLIEKIFKENLKSCAVIGTVNHRIGGRVIPSQNTTPGLVEMQKLLAEMRDQKIEYCAMEVSSHALDQGRVEGIDFNAGVFTNLTQDHLDYHGSMENYFQAKAKLFMHLSEQSAAILNTDDPYARRISKMTAASVVTYGFSDLAQVRADHVHLSLEGSEFDVIAPEQTTHFKTRLIGLHNVYNILAAFAVGRCFRVDPVVMLKGIEGFQCVPGRLEPVFAGQNFPVFVDYAHTDDALQNVLSSFKKILPRKVILVFGCGGNRDRLKRSKMGRVASRLADYCVLTTDNPRNEDPQAILRDILDGFESNQYEIILDRKRAIGRALSLATDDSIVLIAGKGHENYQIVGDQSIHFDDREIVREYFQCSS